MSGPTREVVGACSLDCPDACAWVVTVDDDGKAIKLRARKDHPYTRGQLCKKVNPWLDYAADPSRLTTPLRRTGPKGTASFAAVSWDDAIDEMATRFTEIIDRVGGAAIWPYMGTGSMGWIQGLNGPHRVFTRMGASDHNLSICSVAGREGINLTVGDGAWLDPEDLINSGLIVLWGTNTVVTNSHVWLIVEDARRRGTPVVAIDPIRTRTAAAADLHLAPRPGTDAALALGLCRRLVELGGHDSTFLADRTLGADAFIESIGHWTGAEVERVTGIPERELDDLAERIIAAPPLAVRVGHGVQRHAGGGQAMRAISCVPAVTGAYGQPGGGALYSSSGTYKGYNVERSRRPSLGTRPRTLTMTRLGHHLLTTDDPRVEALVIFAANPLVSNPGLAGVREGLSRDDLFTVVIDLYPTETTAYADLVLPSTMQHEQTEIIDAYNHRYLQWNEPAVAPPGSCLPHSEIWRRLAAAMGYDDPELFATDEQLAADLLDSDDLRRAGITLERLREAGYLPLPARAEPAVRAFSTPSGRFEFTSNTAAARGLSELPHHLGPHDPPALAVGELALVAPASEWYVNSTFVGTARTMARAERPVVRLHPDDASARDLAEGDAVIVENDRGSFDATITVSDDVAVGVAASAKGWWGQGLNDTVVERDADMGGGAVFHDNAVQIRRRE